jgi:O-methyltransferase involved in polyketide biosynthesis
MDKDQYETDNKKDFISISPSAKALLLLKGLTDIPFARDTAELISFPKKYAPDFTNKDFAFWKRVVHFEQRYWSIDKALSFLPANNFLELSSGFSFRGLDMSRNSQVHYIDSDLPGIVNQKKVLLTDLTAGLPAYPGRLETVPLNALDEEQFVKIAQQFPKGSIIILNEGLLMYLDMTEKEKLCNIIYNVLKQRGGYWVTGDIYIKSSMERLQPDKEDSYKDFSEEHQVYNNMFESFDAAEQFFNKAGFTVESESEVELSKLSSLKYMLANASVPHLLELNPADKIRTTWCLKVKA